MAGFKARHIYMISRQIWPFDLTEKLYLVEAHHLYNLKMHQRLYYWLRLWFESIVRQKAIYTQKSDAVKKRGAQVSRNESGGSMIPFTRTPGLVSRKSNYYETGSYPIYYPPIARPLLSAT